MRLNASDFMGTVKRFSSRIHSLLWRHQLFTILGECSEKKKLGFCTNEVLQIKVGNIASTKFTKTFLDDLQDCIGVHMYQDTSLDKENIWSI